MTSLSRTAWRLAVPVATVTIVAFVAAVAIGLAYPEPVSSGALGPDWQCTRLALVFTMCSPLVEVKTAPLLRSKAEPCPRSARWRAALGLPR
jgi:hypothetical protein